MPAIIEIPVNTAAKLKISAAAILLAAAIFLPEVVSAAWHIAHGRTVNYRSWIVEVPFEWYAVGHGEEMSVQRMARLSWQKPPVANFLPVHFTTAYPFTYDLYGKVQATMLRQRGYILEGQQDVQIAGKPGMCWTFDQRNNHDQLWIACISPKDLTSADYNGSKAYAGEFLALLAQTRRNPTAAN